MTRREPVWGLILGGGLLAAALAPRAPPQAGVVPPQARAIPPQAQAIPPQALPSLATGSARELRAVPGLGERRALALVDARWRRSGGDPPLLLGDIPGVGPASEVQVALWLAFAAAASVEPSRRR